MNNNNTTKSRAMMYTQQLDSLPSTTKDLDSLLKHIGDHLAPKRYAGILHDKDTKDNGDLVKPHVHVMLHFENPRSLDSIAKQLSDTPQQLELWRGKADTGFAYLIHATDQSRTKHQYDMSEVRANFDYPALMAKTEKQVKAVAARNSREKINALLDMLYVGEITREEVEEQLTGSEYSRACTKIKNVYEKYLERCAVKFREEMKRQGRPLEVIWIYGESDVGKSSVAKEIIHKKGNPHCFGGSTRDVFQNYRGEHTLVLDELRPEAINYSDLLRILDPYGEQVMAPSRYNDKILACDLIIVTSPFNPWNFYRELMGLGDSNISRNNTRAKIDNFKQLLRRLPLIMEVNDYWINTVEYNYARHTFDPVKDASRYNPYSSLNRPAPATKKNIDLFNKYLLDMASQGNTANTTAASANTVSTGHIIYSPIHTPYDDYYDDDGIPYNSVDDTAYAL